MPYHDGELEVQARAGVRELAERVGRIIGGSIPEAAMRFLAARPIVITSTIDAGGRVTASVLAGSPGFARAEDEKTLRIDPRAGHIERIRRDLASDERIGILAIDFATRRRIRVNGRGHVDGSSIVVRTIEVYSNCPQYIHDHELSPGGDVPDATARESASLDLDQQAMIRAANTFFIASAHPAGADASHRGGDPGFVQVDSPSRLSFGDYSGNNMFNTLGNLATNPACGLLFIDFDSGRTLQLHGSASIDWDPARAASIPGAGRIIDFAVANVIDTEAVIPVTG